jgi:hypothetical protein
MTAERLKRILGRIEQKIYKGLTQHGVTRAKAWESKMKTWRIAALPVPLMVGWISVKQARCDTVFDSLSLREMPNRHLQPMKFLRPEGPSYRGCSR